MSEFEDFTSGKQYPLAVAIELNYTDLPTDESAVMRLTKLPANAIVTRLTHRLITAFADDAAETQTMDIGTEDGGRTDDPNAFTATPIDIDGTPITVSALAAATEVGMLYQYTEPVWITAKLNPSVGAAAITAGKVLITVEAIVMGRSQENVG